MPSAKVHFVYLYGDGKPNWPTGCGKWGKDSPMLRVTNVHHDVTCASCRAFLYRRDR